MPELSSLRPPNASQHLGPFLPAMTIGVIGAGAVCTENLDQYHNMVLPEKRTNSTFAFRSLHQNVSVIGITFPEQETIFLSLAVQTCACCSSHVSDVPLGSSSWFYHSAISKHVIRAHIMVEMGFHCTKMVPVQSHNSFLDQRSRKVIV